MKRWEGGKRILNFLGSLLKHFKLKFISLVTVVKMYIISINRKISLKLTDNEVSLFSFQKFHGMDITYLIPELHKQLYQLQHQSESESELVSKKLKTIQKVLLLVEEFVEELEEELEEGEESGLFEIVYKEPSEGSFLSPTQVKRKMALFAGWDPQELKTRVDITKVLCNYIKANNLTVNKKMINPDAQLQDLLQCSSEPFSFFTLQMYVPNVFMY